MAQRELAYRRHLIAEVGGRWLVAIQVESHLCPGIPDLSYVIVSPGHETGWLELKVALKSKGSKNLLLKVEPSQHQWMIRYAHRVPTHFLIKLGSDHFLIDGRFHQALAGPVTADDLRRTATAIFTDETLGKGLVDILSALTLRDRNGH